MLGGRAEACERYSFGRPIQWGCFCSASSDLVAVKALASAEHSLICKLIVRHGKAVAPYAFLPHTGEVQLGPHDAAPPLAMPHTTHP